MTSPQFQKSSRFLVALSGFIALSLTVPPLQADTPASPTTFLAKSTRENALAFLKIHRIGKICEQPITFSAEDATLEDVATRIEKLLGTSPIAPKLRIEVRKAQPVRLTFSAKESSTSDILTSAAQLAGVQVWVFSDHLLLAPKETLSSDGQSLLEKGMVMEAQGQFDRTNERFLAQQHLAFTGFISDEIKGLKAQLTENAPSTAQTSETDIKLSEVAKMSAHSLVASTTFGQLSPNAQEMLQQLIGSARERFMADQPQSLLAMPQMPKLSLTSTTPIAVLLGQSDQVEVFFTGADRTMVRMNWGINNTSGGWGGQFPFLGALPPVPPLPFNPSAGKS